MTEAAHHDSLDANILKIAITNEFNNGAGYTSSAKTRKPGNSYVPTADNNHVQAFPHFEAQPRSRTFQTTCNTTASNSLRKTTQRNIHRPPTPNCNDGCAIKMSSTEEDTEKFSDLPVADYARKNIVIIVVDVAGKLCWAPLETEKKGSIAVKGNIEVNGIFLRGTHVDGSLSVEVGTRIRIFEMLVKREE